MLLPGPLLVSFLAAWIISRRMDIPLTISRIRHRRRRDKEPGIRTEKFPKKKIPGSGWNPHSFPASKGRIQKSRNASKTKRLRVPAAKEMWDPGMLCEIQI